MNAKRALLLVLVLLLLANLACGLPPCQGSECRTQGCAVCIGQ